MLVDTIISLRFWCIQWEIWRSN